MITCALAVQASIQLLLPVVTTRGRLQMTVLHVDRLQHSLQRTQCKPLYVIAVVALVWRLYVTADLACLVHQHVVERRINPVLLCISMCAGVTSEYAR